jgi:cytochrome d ubiquinol oxidase subunit II
VALGLTVFFLSRVLGLLYFMNSIHDQAIYQRSKKQLLYNTLPFLVFFLYFTIALMFKDGVAYRPETEEMVIEQMKYLHNLVAMPLNTLMFLIGVAAVLYGILSSYLKGGTRGIWYAGGGTILTVWALFILAGFNNTSFYPSLVDLQASLTIQNASSTHFTLTAMSYVSLWVPVVIWYISYVWKMMNKTQITTGELEQEHHY